MGIHGIYKEIGPGERIALSKLAVQTYEQKGRPLRLAIDISIWLFQIQSSKGGSNPALRTFYYRLLRLISLSIHPLFVFDGPNKPPFKRNKRTGGANVSSIPEFLAKQLLKQFGLPWHVASGEAEAECALLQRMGIVDAVLSEDVDTLMFGSGMTIRNWSPEQKATTSKVPTHVNVYYAGKTKETSGLDREGMVLIALMSGGDYIPEGIPGCGPKLACEAARAGFGKDLCAIDKKDDAGFKAWRERLSAELKTNKSKFFARKRSALVIPDDFPNVEILGYYTNPALSSASKLESLRLSLAWDQPLDFPSLRTFAAEAFEWLNVGGAKKFIRNLAPAMLVKTLRTRGDIELETEDLEQKQKYEEQLVQKILGTRQHHITDNTPEMRVSFRPIDLVPIDLSIEPEDDIPDEAAADSESEAPLPSETGDTEAVDATVSPRKRGPSKYDPLQVERIWVLETWVKVGVPLMAQDYEEIQRNPKRRAIAKGVKAGAQAKVTKPRAKKAPNGGMQRGALEQFGKISKAGTSASGKDKVVPSSVEETETLDLSNADPFAVRRQPSRPIPPSLLRSSQSTIIDIFSSPAKPSGPVIASLDLSGPAPETAPSRRRRRSPLQRIQTAPMNLPSIDPDDAPPAPSPSHRQRRSSDNSLPSPSQLLSPHAKRSKTTKTTTTRSTTRTTVPRRPVGNVDSPKHDWPASIPLSSSPPRQTTIEEMLRRSASVTPRRAKPSAQMQEKTSFLEPRILQDDGEDPSEQMSGKARLDDQAEEIDLTGSPTPKARPRSRTALANVAGNTSPTKSRMEITGQDEDRPPRSTTTIPTQAQQRAPPPIPVPALEKEVVAAVMRVKKQKIQLRESLEGSWKITDVEELDLSGPSLSSSKIAARAGLTRTRREWRLSEVESLDLTGV